MADDQLASVPPRDAAVRKALGVPADALEFDFGPYHVVGQLGAGGMGVIYRSVERKTGRVYALKVLITQSSEEGPLRRFIAEARSALSLDHPNIVKVHDVGVLESVPYFAMDLIPGRDLEAVLETRRPPLVELVKILGRVCQAVQYANERGIIHRDLKPANIIVRADGVPILTDFGLAKNLASEAKLTAPGTMIGSPLFMPPEQASGAERADARSDVWGLGVILYIMVAGKPPFLGRNPYEILRRIKTTDPLPPSKASPGAPDALDAVCLKALAKRPEDRYQSARELADELARFLRGEPLLAAPAGPDSARAVPARTSAAPPGRLRWLRALGAVVAALAGAAIFWLSRR